MIAFDADTPPTAPPRRVAVFLNDRAGRLAAGSDSPASARQVEAAFAMERMDSVVSLVPAAGLPYAVGQAARAGFDAVAVGGGDGTIGAAAGGLVGTATPLAVLPLGTLNHFARDLGIPRDLGNAVRLIAHGHVRSVDVGEIGGHVFLNNASIGFYPEVVGDREDTRRRAGLGKWPATLRAVVAVLRRFPLLTVRLEVDGRPLQLRTPFVFVGNNAYEFRLMSLGTRGRLDGGTLSLYVSRRASRLALIRFALLALAGRLEQDRDFEACLTARLELSTPHRRLRVALDGEVVVLAPPLVCRTRPGALRVLAPPEA
jgi:diacylglycerol kinase family enzyme